MMIANCSPADYNFDETLSTLRYASRAKFIKNKPIINEDPKDALLKEYANEIKQLKKMLSQQGNGELGEIKMDSQNDVNEKLREKEEELNSEKEEKRRLLDRIRELETRHVEAKDVHIDDGLVEKFEKAKIIAQEEEGEKKRMMKNKTFYEIEKEEQSLENEGEG